MQKNNYALQGIAAAALAASSSAFTPNALAAPVLEEVVVTAQLREQSLQDVPVSVSAIGGEKMMESGLSKIEDLSAYVPNFTMSESGIGTDIFIRGIGSGENQGFEQSVGMYVDGISYSRAQLARAPFLDLARVEVLRGPQNILLGKNSVAGAISISTADPTDQFEGSTQVTYEPDVGERIVDLVLSGPMTDSMGYRFAVRARQQDGHIYNLVLDRDEAEREELTLRGKLKWDIRDDLSASFKVELGSFDVDGRASEIITNYPSTSTVPFFAGRTYGEIMYDTQFPGAGGAGLGALAGLLPQQVLDVLQVQGTGDIINIQGDPGVLNNVADRKRHSNGDYSYNDTQNFTAKVDWYYGDHLFTSITGIMAYQYEEDCDCDFTGAPLFQVLFDEEYKQFSQEFRWISPAGEKVEYIAGAYFHKSALDFYDTIYLPSDIIPQLVNAADLTEGGARGDNDPAAGSSSAFEVLGIGDAGNALRGIRTPRYFTSDSLIASGFMQATWNLDEYWRLTLGGRYTWENKEGSRKMDFAFEDGTIQPLGEVDTAAAVSFAAERHSLKGERQESQFAPLLNIQWDVSGDMMAYFSASRGFKSGGFDARSNASPSADPTPINPNAPTGTNQRVLIGSFEYEEEQATTYEIGTKMTLLEGAAELNVALFRTEFEDLQVSIFDGTLGFNVGNAASALSQGLELDGRMALTENLVLSGGLAFLDFEFGEHLFGTCKQDEAPTNPNGVNCDYSGKTNQYVADYSGNLLLAYERPITKSLMLRANLDAVFTDEYYTSQNLDDRVKQDAYIQYNGRLAVSSLDGDWELALLGKNLTDELIIIYSADAPTGKTITGATAHHAFINAPRTFALQASYRW
ncbi:TonB-dependent receptor [Spongiibacter sp. KMU-158]|uniref:TonB-dependent receptor n=1 Tax=Spongiibacter pelagi TaxID=2760804 RepID=A0A927BY46_9GAMM|nr:TonB-dependent receptor [Spongiibacter pelagi]MBD2857699.1 TonB-dependent receptor [Spongiibacter pelagi]